MLHTQILQILREATSSGADPGYSEGRVRLTIAALYAFGEQPLRGNIFIYTIFSYHKALL